MTQHEYVFVAISVVLGLAITRLLSSAAALIRAKQRVRFHWSTALWSFSVMLYVLQLWWVGWELRTVSEWAISDFFIMITGAICIYGAAELALPAEDYDVSDDAELDFLAHSQSIGRLSALSMLIYYMIGPYVNVTLFGNPLLASLVVPTAGISLMLLTIWKPAFFKVMSVLFAIYTVTVLVLTA
ncbi:MAG: hypothetical protein ACR2QG_03160 [Gammaproteobacteria bacterium]